MGKPAVGAASGASPSLTSVYASQRKAAAPAFHPPALPEKPTIVEAAVDDIEFFESCPNNCGVSTYCVTTPNSVGPGARIGYSGSASIVDNDLELLAFGAPSQVFSGFIYSPDRIQQSTVNGTLCIGSATLGFFGRTSVVQTDGLGFARLSFDNTAAPLPPLQVNAGETWNFQFVHRDLINGQAAFRYSDGLSVTFCP